MTNFRRGVILAVCIGALGACSNLSNRDERTLSGGAIGAGVGAVGAAVVGGPVLLGAGLGAVGGAVIGNVTTPK